MELNTILLVALIALIVIFGLAFMFRKKDINENHLSDRVDALNKHMVNTMIQMQKQMEERLKESSDSQFKGSKQVGDRLDNAAKAMQGMIEKFTKIEEGNKRIYDVGKDIASLQEILRAPKLRGGLGEYFLGDLLSQILPKDHFKLQHSFKDGQMVDAVIMLRDKLLVPVDAKFPLENFLQMLSYEKENDEESAAKARKLFVNQVKKHIDDITTKYIRPDEGTLDFALMYIPAENVYYETIIKDEGGLVAYAHQKKVFPVSPNSFYIYLQAILMGLRGLQIEKETKNIIAGLGTMRKEFEKFSDDFRLIGKHLGNAKSSYENSEKRLERFDGKLEQVIEMPELES